MEADQRGLKVTNIEQVPPTMDGDSLARLERVARNLPIVGNVKMRSVDAAFGTVYIAYGRAADMNWHGVWGLRGIGRICGFGYGLAEKQVQQNLLDDAAVFHDMADKREMWDKGFFGAGRS